MILVLDNYDSFTYNVVHYLGELGVKCCVFRNDEITTDQVRDMAPDKIVVSPGPCTPNEAGISVELIQRFCHRTPILGICLGHQSIGQAFGGKVVRAGKVMHGKTSEVLHSGHVLFKDIPSSFVAVRYHSLVVEKESLPESLELSAWTIRADGSVDEIMALRHKQYPVFGVQFHPESIASEHGHKLLSNFLEYSS